MVSWLYETGVDQIVVFSLVLTRLLGLIVIAPIFGSTNVPLQIRALLAAALAFIAAPPLFGSVQQLPQALPDLTIMMTGEFLIGLALGAGVVILFSGVDIAGKLISQVSGLQASELLNPDSGESAPLFSNLLNLVTLAVFVAIGGHRLVMAALLDSFAALPPGGGVPTGLAHTLSTLVGESFELSARAAAPVMTALLLATLVLALVGRTLPQLNILVLGFGVNSLVSLGALAVALGAIVWAFQGQLEPMMAQLFEALGVRENLSSLVSSS